MIVKKHELDNTFNCQTKVLELSIILSIELKYGIEERYLHMYILIK